MWEGQEQGTRDTALDLETSGRKLRPILTPSARKHALQLLQLGLIEIEQAADGRLWAISPGRRAG